MGRKQVVSLFSLDLTLLTILLTIRAGIFKACLTTAVPNYDGDGNSNVAKTNRFDKQSGAHPKTVFCKISVRRSKNCLDFSIA